MVIMIDIDLICVFNSDLVIHYFLEEMCTFIYQIILDIYFYRYIN